MLRAFENVPTNRRTRRSTPQLLGGSASMAPEREDTVRFVHDEADAVRVADVQHPRKIRHVAVHRVQAVHDDEARATSCVCRAARRGRRGRRGETSRAGRRRSRMPSIQHMWALTSAIATSPLCRSADMRPTPPEKPLGNSIASSCPVRSDRSRSSCFLRTRRSGQQRDAACSDAPLIESPRDRGGDGGMPVEAEVVERRQVDDLAHARRRSRAASAGRMPRRAAAERGRPRARWRGATREIREAPGAGSLSCPE